MIKSKSVLKCSTAGFQMVWSKKPYWTKRNGALLDFTQKCKCHKILGNRLVNAMIFINKYVVKLYRLKISILIIWTMTTFFSFFVFSNFIKKWSVIKNPKHTRWPLCMSQILDCSQFLNHFWKNRGILLFWDLSGKSRFL